MVGVSQVFFGKTFWSLCELEFVLRVVELR
jgi:hypothetical protein